jgi:ABC-type multidrug transport system fused ATPase/permease subunit
VESGIYRFILRYSKRDQIALVLLSLAGMPILYYSFELPKIIINEALADDGQFPKSVLGFELEQIPFLMTLSAAFLALVLLGGAFKFLTSTYRYRVGDRLLRRLRYELIERLLRFPVKNFRTQSSGQVVSMVAAETSPLGFFMSEAFTVPTVAAGTLFTVLLFIFMQDWLMGAAALALYPLQLYLIPKIQTKLNDLERRRAIELRHVSDNVEHIIANAAEIHGHDTSRLELAIIGKRLQTIFDIRVRIATLRYTINVLNQFFSQLTPFFFLSIGGYLVIQDEISIGSLVAVLAAHKDMYAPWKDLIDYYQKAADSSVKYAQLSEFFSPNSLLDRSVITGETSKIDFDEAALILSNVIVDSGDGVKPLDGVNLRLPLPAHVAFVGGNGNSRDELSRLLQRQTPPTSGEVRIGETNLSTLPDRVISRVIAYAGPDSLPGSGTFRQSLLYPLARNPARELQNPREIREASLTGNSTLDPDADWIDYDAVCGHDRLSLDAHIDTVLHITGLDADALEWGIRRNANELNEDTARQLLAARDQTRRRLAETHLADAVESFDPTRFMENASILENVVFGALRDGKEDDARVIQSHVLSSLDQADLTSDLTDKGRNIAALMIEMFRDLDPADAFFQSFNFIRSDEMPEFERLLRRYEGMAAFKPTDEDRQRLLQIALQLIPAKHPIGMIDDRFRSTIIEARMRFRETLPEEMADRIAFFDSAVVNPALSVRDNLIYGKTVIAHPDQLAKIDEIIRLVVEDRGLSASIRRLGMQYEIGVGGARLTASQRQRLVLARALIKKPNILIAKEAFSAIEPSKQSEILRAVKSFMNDSSFFIIEPDESRTGDFKSLLELRQGRLFERKLLIAADATTSAPSQQRHVGLGATAEILSQIPLFAAIDRAKLKLLAFTSDQLDYASQQYVFRQGEPGEKAYVILDGEVDVVLEQPERETIVATLGRHQIFGEMSLLAAQPRSTSIRCNTDVRVLALRQDVFVKLVQEDASIALAITRVLISRLSSTLRDVGRR